MKRTVLLILVLMLVLCGCSKNAPSAPTAEEVKKYIPLTADISVEKYPLLEQAPPTLEECMAQVPEEFKTFTYHEEDWVAQSDNTLASKLGLTDDSYQYFNAADGSEDIVLCYDSEFDYYELLTDPIDETEEYTQYNCFYSYNSEGELDYYSNLETGLAFEIINPDTFQIRLYGTTADYSYNYEFDELDSISVFPIYSDAVLQSGYSFDYYPRHQAFRNVCYDYQGEEFSYTAYYTADNQLESVYYSSADMTAEYDGNLQLTDSGTYSKSFFQYLFDQFS